MGEFRNGDEHRHVVVDVPMSLMVAPTAVPVTARLHYSTRDPYAVEATFSRPGHSDVVWVFARELLMTGVARECGIGDVCITPMGEMLVLDLDSPEGSARLTASSTDIRRFVTRMLSVVPAGAESLDLDAELAHLTSATELADRRET